MDYNVLLCLLCFSSSIRFAMSQVYGPDNCLINRLDVIPCEFRNKNLVKPLVGQQGIYTTILRPGSAGSPICRVRNQDHVVQNLAEIVNVRLINSPGFLVSPPIPYPDQQLVLYNVTCPEGYISYFDLMDLNMERPNCLDVNLNRQRCRDYVSLNRPPFGAIEFCGNDTATAVPQNTSALQPGNLEMTFRTSTTDSFAGFRASVVCFRQQDRDLPGCTQGASGMPSSPGDTARRRRKREAEANDLEEFHNQWKRKLAAIKRQRNKRQNTKDEIFSRFLEINVPFEASVMYDQGTLKFFDSESEEPLNENPELGRRLPDIEDITFLHTFDAESNVDSFKSTFSSTQLIPGPGPMFIVGRDAYFQLFIIDPRGILPTEEEAAAITNITSAQFAIVQEEPLSESFFDREPVDPVIDLGLPPTNRRRKRNDGRVYPSRKKRQTVEMKPVNDTVFTDDDIILALMNENACNPVLRSSALSTIEFVEGFNKTRVDVLRESLLVTDAPTTIEETTTGSGQPGGITMTGDT